MVKKDCTFCKIAKGESPAYIVYKDKNYIAFLDIFPNIKGQTLVITRRHTESYAFDMNDKKLADLIRVSKKVAKILEAKLGVARIHLVLEGTGINHMHVKLYPAIGLKSRRFKEFVVKKNVYFNRYPGYVTTLMGPKAGDQMLKALQDRIVKK
ncbi:MAG: HIT domain-containing protein [Candidatus Marsarchaeota archaeon]|jgi:diadenosine tetraphosphate (Ap4A) HIT family hydrolase|nr:HIT domain-containing protein [Candidatus Marsarchaeota archaeon]MCL5111867.1 HIT domain-containing protein [Candidatus Marsarchaeota archaeon]